MRGRGPLPAAITVAAAVSVVIAAAGASGCGPAAPAPPASSCPEPHADGWCDACDAGHVAAIRVPSRQLFEVLDAHGHDIDPAALRCPACRENVRAGGFCDDCRMGFVRGQAYLSRLAYHAARAGREDPAGVECPTCRSAAMEGGWCERCDLGRVGVLVVSDRGELEEARGAVRKLRLAVAALERCETCAIALFADGRCPACDIAYRDGEPRPPEPDPWESGE